MFHYPDDPLYTFLLTTVVFHYFGVAPIECDVSTEDSEHSEPLNGATLTPHESHGRLITQLVTVSKTEGISSCVHTISHPSIPPCVPPAAGYLLISMSCQWPEHTPTQGHAHTHFHTGPHAAHIKLMHLKASKMDTKDTHARIKCEICESDFVIQAITHTVTFLDYVYACARSDKAKEQSITQNHDRNTHTHSQTNSRHRMH
ncbi:hypothetical protein ABVT39_007480 [Epinephelus coioides]